MLNDRGLKTGVIANKVSWASIFGLDTYCPEIKDSLLAWLPSSYEQNKLPNFDHYSQIGGWIQPFCKYYAVKVFADVLTSLITTLNENMKMIISYYDKLK